MDGRMDGQMNGPTDGPTEGWMDGQTDGQTDRQTDGQTDGRTEGQTNSFGWIWVIFSPELMTIIGNVPCKLQDPNPSNFQPAMATKQCQIFLKLVLMVRITRPPDPSEFQEDCMSTIPYFR